MTDEIVNLTPHAIDLYKGKTLCISIAPSGLKLRVPNPLNEPIGDVYVKANDNDASVNNYVFQIVRIVFAPESAAELIDEQNNVIGPLPVAEDGKFYIVSRIAAMAMPERTDLLMVDGTIRDDTGRIIGCTGFAIV